MGADGATGQAAEPILLTEGPMAGWRTWLDGSEPYESSIGPFCFREDENGRLRAGFMPTRQHLNGGGALHGGALMSFADFCLFILARRELAGTVAVTVTFNGEFISAGAPDRLVEGVGEVLRATRSMVFVRGLLRQHERTVLAFSGTLKKIG